MEESDGRYIERKEGRMDGWINKEEDREGKMTRKAASEIGNRPRADK